MPLFALKGLRISALGASVYSMPFNFLTMIFPITLVGGGEPTKKWNEICRRFPDFSRLVSLFVAIILTTGIASCSPARNLIIRPVEPQYVPGNYKLLLYGCRHPDDIENMVILDKEGDNITFDVHAPAFEYTVKGNASGEEALREAERFLKCSFYYEQSQLSMLMDSSGQIIGYELRPLYSAVRFGTRDVFYVQYREKAERVVVYIRLDPEVERFIQSPGNGDQRERK